MSKINVTSDDKHERTLKVRQVNHIQHHAAASSKALMRVSVVEPVKVEVEHKSERQIRANAATGYHKSVSLGPTRQASVSEVKVERARSVNQSAFISHFAKPDSRSFVPTFTQATAPLNSMLHKPVIQQQSVEELFEKAIDMIDDGIQNIEQQPVKRFNRFARALIGNRFNGVALD